MVRDITLTSAMRANLLSLKNTAELLSRTQERLSTGKKVNSPLDNAVNYFAAWSHTSRADDLTARKDNMSEAIQTVKAANDGIQTITTLIETAKGIAQAALATGDLTQRALYVTQYNAILDQVDQLSNDTGYRGTNLLAGGTLTVQFNEDGSSSLDIQGFAATAAGLNIGLVGVAGGVTDWADPTNGMAAINTSLSQLTAAGDTLRVRSSSLSSSLAIVQARADWADQMIATLQAGAGALTDADMNEEGANMLMLQTRQSLGTTALSLSAESAQSVLKLF